MDFLLEDAGKARASARVALAQAVSDPDGYFEKNRESIEAYLAFAFRTSTGVLPPWGALGEIIPPSQKRMANRRFLTKTMKTSQTPPTEPMPRG
jgi:hypothetical protein